MKHFSNKTLHHSKQEAELKAFSRFISHCYVSKNALDFEELTGTNFYNEKLLIVYANIRV